MTSSPLTPRPDAVVGSVDRRLFGSFVEHLGRCVYSGIYEPSHPSADALGFRGDVLELVRELGVTTIRYPGGNFVSSYRWEDGVGPLEERPVRLDLNWHSTDTNEFGTDEFMAWCAAAGVEPMMAVNIGTRGTAEALDLLEYCNHPGGTALSDARRANGAQNPYNVRMWCLGNEMDGPWQVGHMTPEQYAHAAADMARTMHKFDPTIELVACGSSGTGMATFGTWERAVLDACFDEVDFISAHAYYDPTVSDLESFLRSSDNMDRFIRTVVDIADEVAAARGSDKRIAISFDEWNVWRMASPTNPMPSGDDWPIAPALLEDVYTVADAVVVGSLLITLLRHANRVRAASLAQLVNVIAPIMTEPGGSAWRQTTFYPFSITASLAGETVLETPRPSEHVDAVVTWDGERDVTVFAVNLDAGAGHDLVLDLAGLGDVAGAEVALVTDPDPLATNTADAPDRVTPAWGSAIVTGATVTVALPAVSWAAVRVTLR
ncbi:alpha-N-arabinofuranosidase [Demequina sp.]|uniref:arabinosylfuranosidase ArfA n=1 Tax=Demequina sp. TaxID=2050685 RepID=UPI003D12DEEF